MAETGESFAHTYAPGELSLEDENVRLIGEASVEGRASRKRDEVKVKGIIRGAVEVACDRCLKPVAGALEVEFDAAFIPKERAASASENVELQEEDLAVSFYEGEAVNIDELVREQILLALPTRQLCREECLGLCPTCGKDLNAEQCSCQQGETDPRWAALADLKNNGN
ncbi:MAG TPA: DUF177 domain-containing protein [Pyrinomonadaceae bacterium]|nr:DUF177 domain-containing protein [Pyrinomonadaceae bacterium]